MFESTLQAFVYLPCVTLRFFVKLCKTIKNGKLQALIASFYDPCFSCDRAIAVLLQLLYVAKVSTRGEVYSHA
jgi:hypothetical protein